MLLRRALCSGWAVLAAVGIAHVLRGIAYLPSVVRESDRLPWVEEIAPLGAWCILWVAVGAATVVCAVLRRGMIPAASAAIGISMFWAVLYLVGWMTGESVGGYVTALTYLTISGVLLAYFTLLFQRIGGADGV